MLISCRVMSFVVVVAVVVVVGPTRVVPLVRFFLRFISFHSIPFHFRFPLKWRRSVWFGLVSTHHIAAMCGR